MAFSSRLLEAEFADHAHYGLDILYRRGGDNAVAKVEDVAGATVGRAKNLFDSEFKDFKGREEGDGIEISLHRVVVARGAPAFVERLTPVEADDVCAGGSHFCEQAAGFDSEVDDGNAHGLDGTYKTLGGFKGVFPVVGKAEGTDPAIEDLDDVRAGEYLEAAVVFENLDDLVEEQTPGEGVAIHHGLGVDVVFGAAALDHVAGEGEGCAAEADDAEAVFEVSGDLLDGASDVGEIVCAVGAEGAYVFRGADGMMDDGTFACLELERQSHGLQREQEVGKDDGGIHAQLFSGGDGDLSRDFRLLADFDEGVVLANVAVFLHVAAGLAEKPHGSAIDGATETGANKAASVENGVGNGFYDRDLIGWIHTAVDFNGRNPLRG